MKKYDWWMFEVIEEALRALEIKKCFTTRGRKIYRENRNRFNELGQIRLIQERTVDIRQEMNDEIVADLKKGLGMDSSNKSPNSNPPSKG